MKLYFPGLLALTGLTAGAAAAQSLDAIVARMDSAAEGFRGMTAQVKQVRYTAVINETEEESGVLTLVRPKPGDLRMLAEFGAPNQRAVAFQNRKLQIFYPKMQTVQEYDLGKQASLVDQFLLLGFGTPGSSIRKSYEMKYAGEDSAGGQKCARLELVPKSEEARKHVRRIEMWISESAGQPVQQKIYQGAKDYTLVTYTNLKLNPPLAANATRLKLPSGVKREYPQR
jgi:outer membrane lipoprotein-sorting protein